MTEIALIAFDGLDPRKVMDMRDELPNFDSLMDNSVYGKWETPGHTIPSFVATVSGRTYDEYNFHWDEGKGNYQRHRQTEFSFMWENTDKSMTLLNIPILYPPENIDDCMVSGFLTPDNLVESNLARPQEVQDYLNEINYQHDVKSDVDLQDADPEEIVKGIEAMMDKRVEAAKELYQRYKSDLFYGVWTGTDRWFHIQEKIGGDIDRIYKKADEVLSEMIDTLPNDIPLIVFSDHGFSHYVGDNGIHNGHMKYGFYAIRNDHMPNARSDGRTIYDLYPTVLNYLEGEIDNFDAGSIIFSNPNRRSGLQERLDNLGYK